MNCIIFVAIIVADAVSLAVTVAVVVDYILFLLSVRSIVFIVFVAVDLRGSKCDLV